MAAPAVATRLRVLSQHLSSRGRWCSLQSPIARTFCSSAGSPGATADEVVPYAVVDGGHPLIDVSPLLPQAPPPCPDARRRVLAEMKAALLHCGYFYASNVSVLPPEYIEEVYAVCETAHALPVDVKARYARVAGAEAARKEAEQNGTAPPSAMDLEGSYSGSDVEGAEELM